MPSSGEVLAGAMREDPRWPTPEPQHRIAQLYLEPILRRHAAAAAGVDLRYLTRAVGLTQHEEGVTVVLEDLKTGRRQDINASYVIGCDGARSMVRKALRIKFDGIDALGTNVSSLFRSRELGRLNAQNPTWMTMIFNPNSRSSLVAIDGQELWLNHQKFPVGYDTADEDPEQLAIEAVGQPIDFELLGSVHWTPRRLVAQRFSEGRVFLAGDAAHLWIPLAGFGMNAGIQEATSLAWMLSAIHHGWAGADLLEAYDRERRPIGQDVADAVAGIGIWGVPVDPHIEDQGPEGDAIRADAARQLKEADSDQFHAVGLNFATNYANSPLVVDDGSPMTPPLRIGEYEQSARPGSRLPHRWMRDGSALYDHLGPDFTLLRVGASAPDGQEILAAAAARGVPVTQLVIDDPGDAELYGAGLLLVRPDQHVAWRGDSEPQDPGDLIDRVRGVSSVAAVR